jgi:hypothetical protein
LSDWALAGALFLKIANDQKLSNRLNSTYYNRLQKGDALLRRTGLQGCKLIVVVPLCQFWAFTYEHWGIYYGKRLNGDLVVYESTRNGGVTVYCHYKYVAKNARTMSESTVAQSDVYRSGSRSSSNSSNKYGSRGQTPCNFNFDQQIH